MSGDRHAFVLNGVAVEADCDVGTPLLDVLREQFELRGTRRGCGNGECGACAIVVDGRAMCACLLPVHRVAGRHVLTVEGLAGADGRLSRLQQAFVDAGATQCGFCTSGMLMSACALLGRNPRPTEADVVDALAGNLCRCTGYRQIIDAVLAAATVADAAPARNDAA